MKRALLAIFVLSATAWAEPRYLVRRVRVGPDGLRYISVDRRGEKGHADEYSGIIRLDAQGNIDRSFGNGGVVSFAQWEGWPSATVRDFGFDSSGNLYATGNLQSFAVFEETKMEEAISAVQETISKQLKQLEADALAEKKPLDRDVAERALLLQVFFAGLKGLERTGSADPRDHLRETARRLKESTWNGFVSKFDSQGKLVKGYGDYGEGTLIFSRGFSSEESVEALSVKANGEAAVLAMGAPHDGTGLVAKATAGGELDKAFNKTGTLKLTDAVNSLPPSGRKKASWYLDDIHLSDAGIRVLGSNSHIDKDIVSAFVANYSPTGEKGPLVRLPTRRNVSPLPMHEMAALFSADGKSVFQVLNTTGNLGPRSTIHRIDATTGETVAVVSPGRQTVLDGPSEVDLQAMPDGGLEFTTEENGAVVRFRFDERLRLKENAAMPDILDPETARCALRFQKLLP